MLIVVTEKNSTLQEQGVSDNSVYKTRGLSVIFCLRANLFESFLKVSLSSRSSRRKV